MPETMQISTLIDVPAENRDLPWLKQALQTAARLEFATIPPYLCALWSLKEASGPAYESLREVVMEEMLHLGLVANMLTTLGETPAFYPDAAPAYPCKLPGGVRPGLTIPLQGLTRSAIKDVFMEIEKPHHDISGLDDTDETDPTIGDFYTAIGDTFEQFSTAISGQRQLARNLRIRAGVNAVLFKILTIEDVRKALHIIKEQGEGTATSPIDHAKMMAADLAHYFRFAELYVGRAFQIDSTTGRFDFIGDPIELPPTYPMAVVPPGGYLAAAVPAAVAELLQEFDQTYTTMLQQLHAAWQQGQIGKLNASVATMFSMTDLATALMQQEITPGGPTYGPCFRLVP